MEPNNDLDFLREMSASQLATLLQYDSPPETPNQPPGNDRQQPANDDAENEEEQRLDLCDSIMQFNREPLPSQMDSQIDFSIFHNDPENLDALTQSWSLSGSKTQCNENDNSVIISTPHIDHITLDNTELPDMSKNEENEKDVSNKDLYNAAKTSGMEAKMNADDFEFDGILENIDFEQLSNLEEAYWNKKDVTKRFQRECQTQVELNDIFKPNERTIASCPPFVIKASSIYCCSTHATNLSQFSIIAKTIDTQNELNSLVTPNERVAASSHPPVTEASCCPTHATNLSQFDNANFSLASKTIQTQFEFNSLANPNLHDDFNERPTQDNDIVQFSASHPTIITFPQQQSILTKDQQQTENVNTTKSSITDPNQTATAQTLGNTTADATLMPSSVKQLYDVVKVQYSDFAFVYALSAQLCQDRIPMECFVTLKMALLLSLASIGPNPDRQPIPIVAIGNDTYMTDYLMNNVGQLGTRFVGHTDDSKPPSSNGYRNHNWIEANPILLAKGGVYYVGDWSRLKLRRAENLFKDIECSSVAVDKSNHQYPLETAIWTHWRSFKYNAKDQQTFNKFVKIFGIPIFVADDNHETLVNYTLEQASIRVFESTIDHLSINSDDMRNFLVQVSQRNVDLSPAAAVLLQRYFVASRAARQDCLSKQAYVMLKQFSESFAKLALRHEVLTIDALAAIILCEHFIENIFGSSDNPPPHFGALPFVGAVDEYIVEFQQWLDVYIEKYADK